MREHRKVISVVASSSGSGATYIGTRLALEMGKLNRRVTFLEDNSCNCLKCEKAPLVFYEQDLHKKYRMIDFFFEKATGRAISHRVNYCKGVNWVVKTPESPVCRIYPEDVTGEYIIWDFSEEFYKSDVVLCVIIPEKKYLMAGLETIRFCRDMLPGKTFFLFNKVRSKAAVKRAESLLGIEADLCFSDSEDGNEEAFRGLAEQIITLL